MQSYMVFASSGKQLYCKLTWKYNVTQSFAYNLHISWKPTD